MSIAIDYYVRCDNCNHTDFASHTAREAREEAHRYGWERKGNKDYCPRCLGITEVKSTQTTFRAKVVETIIRPEFYIEPEDSV